MTTAVDQDRAPLRSDAVAAAANDDHVGLAKPEAPTAATGGWDAYDVWRRLIKEARERRAGGALPQ